MDGQARTPPLRGATPRAGEGGKPKVTTCTVGATSDDLGAREQQYVPPVIDNFVPQPYPLYAMEPGTPTPMLVIGWTGSVAEDDTGTRALRPVVVFHQPAESFESPVMVAEGCAYSLTPFVKHLPPERPGATRGRQGAAPTRCISWMPVAVTVPGEATRLELHVRQLAQRARRRSRRRLRSGVAAGRHGHLPAGVSRTR
jgi:hypothetical protein